MWSVRLLQFRRAAVAVTSVRCTPRGTIGGDTWHHRFCGGSDIANRSRSEHCAMLSARHGCAALPYHSTTSITLQSAGLNDPLSTTATAAVTQRRSTLSAQPWLKPKADPPEALAGAGAYLPQWRGPRPSLSPNLRTPQPLGAPTHGQSAPRRRVCLNPSHADARPSRRALLALVCTLTCAAECTSPRVCSSGDTRPVVSPMPRWANVGFDTKEHEQVRWI